MMILLNKKIKQFYKVNPDTIPPGIFTTDAYKAGIYKEIFMYEADWIANLNTQPEIINLSSVKSFSVFNYQAEYKFCQGHEYLKGGNCRVTFNDGSSIIVTETVNEIVTLAGVRN